MISQAELLQVCAGLEDVELIQAQGVLESRDFLRKFLGGHVHQLLWVPFSHFIEFWDFGLHALHCAGLGFLISVDQADDLVELRNFLRGLASLAVELLLDLVLDGCKPLVNHVGPNEGLSIIENIALSIFRYECIEYSGI